MADAFHNDFMKEHASRFPHGIPILPGAQQERGRR